MALSSRASLLPLLCLLLAVAAAANHQQEQPTPASPPITLPGCPDKCGNVSIPYPFGTKEGCFRRGFFVICNHTLDPPRPFIDSSYEMGWSYTNIIVEDLYYLTNQTTDTEYGPPDETITTSSAWLIELAGVSLSEGKVRLLGTFCYECRLNKTHHSVRRLLLRFGAENSPYLLSDADNVLMGIGSNVIAQLDDGPLCQSYVPNPESPSTDGPVNGSCSGQGCCHSNLPPVLTTSYLYIRKGTLFDDYSGRVSCYYAMIAEKTWYNFSSVDLDSDAFLRRNGVEAGVVPFVADFTVDIGGCPEAGEPTPKDFACISANSKCVDRRIALMNTTGVDRPFNNARNMMAHYCICSVGYEGNPYIQGGCQDIDECARSDMYPCYGKCKNTPGDYECSCPAGTRGRDAKEAPCNDLFSLPAKISVGVVGVLFLIALLVFLMLIRKEKRKMAELYKRNGGPTLEKAKIIKIYKKEELNPIVKPSNFIGRGAFGEVYKGFLDNQLVAVKKPIEVKKPTDASDMQNGQFANEVIIQSQVIHKNIVKLIGCCLEVDKPMLVYEFLPKGSLDDILHGSNRTSITLECRLNIAAESAEGLAYLHSKTTNVILHGDVKPANILLDDSFTPKISDFGISRLIVIDKEHTDFIIGDRTYMDPVYLRDGLLTDKSDVYSFGVVLLELISRKKATYADNNSLVRNFLDAHKSEKEATELFDKEIAKPEVLKLLNSLYEIAVNCLNLDVDKRPKMTEVAENLLMLKRS